MFYWIYLWAFDYELIAPWEYLEVPVADELPVWVTPPDLTLLKTLLLPIEEALPCDDFLCTWLTGWKSLTIEELLAFISLDKYLWLA